MLIIKNPSNRIFQDGFLIRELSPVCNSINGNFMETVAICILLKKMAKIISLILVGSLLLANSQDTPIEKTALKQIFKAIIDADNVKTIYFLIDSIQNFDRKSIIQSGVRYTMAGADIVNTGIWNKELFDSAQIVSANYLDSIAKSRPRLEMPAHYSFSLPYFATDKKSFIIYYNYYCGSLCAEYSLRLYKKVHGKWTFIKSFFSIVS